MPVPTWDCPELVLLDDQPVDVTTTTVVSEDIWKKFDLDFPQPLSFSVDRYYGGIEDGIIPDPYERSTFLGSYEKSGSSPLLSSSSSSSSSRTEAREIRHHDCMWAGLCISKEHNRTHPAKKKDVHHMPKKAVPAGRSLLINRKQPAICNATTTSAGLSKNLESDGDSTRPETPQSCESESEEEEEEDGEEGEEEEEEESESEEEIPRFKHDSISINEKLSEYVGGELHSAIVPVSEVTGQLMSRKLTEKKIIGISMRSAQQMNDQRVKYSKKNVRKEDNANFYGNGNKRQDFGRTTNPVYTQNSNCTNIVSLGDHCYHLNQTSSSKKLEHLGVQTPSDSEEEIDVVTFDKPSCRPASLPTNPSLADKQHLQKTVTSALKDKSPPRPRGRPPSSNTPRKRSAQNETATKKPAKRPRHKTMSYQKRGASNNNNNNSNSKTVNFSINNNNNNNNNNQNNNNNNIKVEKTENCCNSRVSIGTDYNKDKINEEDESGEMLTRDENLNNRRVNGGGNNSPRSMSKDRKLSNYQTSTLTSSRSTSSDDEPDTEKRSLHNNMERQRRIELRNAFEELRVLVPEVEMKEKAPKVVILRQAAVYCDMLTEIEQNTLATVNELKRRQDKLRSRLSQLRRNLRSERRGAEVRNSNHHERR